MFAGEFVVRGRQERASASALRHNVLAVALGAFHERDEFRRGPAFGYPTCHTLNSNCVRWKSGVFAGCNLLPCYLASSRYSPQFAHGIHRVYEGLTVPGTFCLEGGLRFRP
jgi:hypothetical protein